MTNNIRQWLGFLVVAPLMLFVLFSMKTATAETLILTDELTTLATRFSKMTDQEYAAYSAAQAKQLGHRRARERKTAIARLSAGGKRSVPAVAPLLKSPDYRLRESAAIILGNVGYVEGAREIFALMVADKENRVRLASRKSVEALAPHVPELLVEHLNSDNDATVQFVGNMIIQNYNACVPFLEKVLDKGDDKQRLQAKSIIRYKTLATVQRCISSWPNAPFIVLDHPDAIKKKMADIFDKLAGPKIRILLEILADPKADYTIQYMAIRALAFYPGQETLKALTDKLDSPNFTIAIAAADALAQIGSDASVDAILTYLKSRKRSDLDIDFFSALGNAENINAYNTIMRNLKNNDLRYPVRHHLGYLLSLKRDQAAMDYMLEQVQADPAGIPYFTLPLTNYDTPKIRSYCLSLLKKPDIESAPRTAAANWLVASLNSEARGPLAEYFKWLCSDPKYSAERVSFINILARARNDIADSRRVGLFIELSNTLNDNEFMNIFGSLKRHFLEANLPEWPSPNYKDYNVYLRDLRAKLIEWRDKNRNDEKYEYVTGGVPIPPPEPPHPNMSILRIRN